MGNQDIFKAVEIYLERKKTTEILEAVVTTVTPNTVRIQVSGSSQSQEAGLVKGSVVEVGDNVLVLRPRRQTRWLIIGSFNGALAGKVVSGAPTQAFEISPPENITADDSIPGSVVVSWDTPIQQSVAFDVQTNTSQVEAGATTVLTTRGSYAILKVSSVYVRVRSIAPNAHFSAWSDWLLAEPAPIVSDPFEKVLFVNGRMVVTLEGEVVMTE